MGALKQLGYPFQVRILIVHALFEDHALLRIELPEGEWKVYDVVPQNVPTPEARLKPVVEFDEKRVEWYPSENLASYDLRKGNPSRGRAKETAPPAKGPVGWFDAFPPHFFRSKKVTDESPSIERAFSSSGRKGPTSAAQKE